MTTYQVERRLITAEIAVVDRAVVPVESPPLVALAEPLNVSVRNSLRASTLDGVFSSVFENVVKGVLISNFLIGLGAGAIEVGLLASIPMLAHLLQPVGAYFSENSTSRHRYCLGIFSLSRLLWLVLIGEIFWVSRQGGSSQPLIWLTLSILLFSFVLDAMGAASWLSWMAALVPQKLRGRYFGNRKSLASLTALIAVPVGGWLVTHWPGGSMEGYGVVVGIGMVLGIVSLLCQFWMKDINPKEQAQTCKKEQGQMDSLWRDANFLTLLLYLAGWTFALNLNAPFLNFYLLDHLQIDVQWVTVYCALLAGAYLSMMVLWGRLADRIGNRPVLAISSLLTAVIPLLWVSTNTGHLSLWLWLPLLHLMKGGTLAALELCTANIQLELAPVGQQSRYFAIAAAVIGASGFLGTTVGSLLAEISGDLTLLFALSSCLSVIGILPLLFVKEARSCSIRGLLGHLPSRLRIAKVAQVS